MRGDAFDDSEWSRECGSGPLNLISFIFITFFQGDSPPAPSSSSSDMSLLPFSLERRMGLAVLSMSGKPFLACVDCPNLTLLDCDSVKRHLKDHKHQMVAPFPELLSRLQELGVCDLKVSCPVRLFRGRLWVSFLSCLLRLYCYHSPQKRTSTYSSLTFQGPSLVHITHPPTSTHRRTCHWRSISADRAKSTGRRTACCTLLSILASCAKHATRRLTT